MKNFIQEIKLRWTSESPEFFKKISKIALRVILASTALMGIPPIIEGTINGFGASLNAHIDIIQYLPSWYNNLGIHGIISGGITYILCNFTVKNSNILQSFQRDLISETKITTDQGVETKITTEIKKEVTTEVKTDI